MITSIKLLKDKEMMNTIYKLAWPAIVQEALTVFVQYIATAMVGMIGANASAAVGLTSSVNWLINSIFIAFGMGFLAVIAKSFGAGETNRAKKSAVQSIYVVAVVGFIIGVVAYGCSFYLPIWLQGDVSIQEEAGMFFRIISLPMMFRSATLIFGSVLRGAGNTKSPMLVNLVMNIVAIVLNFILIYPPREMFGIYIYGADLGVKGSAIATALSYVVSGSLMIYIFFKDQALSVANESKLFDFMVMKDALMIAFPICLQRTVICLGHIYFAALVSTLGVKSLAAHSIALTVEEAFYVPGYGMQAAASTLVGNAVGRKDEEGLKNIGVAIMMIAFGLLFVLSFLLFLFATNMMMIFSQDKEVITIGSTLLRIVAFSEPVFGIMVILEGIFNGMGDTKAPFIYSAFCMWGVRIVGAIIVIQVFHLPINAVWCMMVLDNVVRCFLLARRFVQGKWKYRLQ